ncbi:MAG TPA: 2-C-methyl-D-erythritol 2,4-cyclodiphosphate synthase, partial [Candidatus Limnocylindria bacterium]|nr:2-C-methyl-D-erythritol 2,4-cyclodiphosphate synthase [Candidatus Limnocylindria bacterium]
ENGFAPLQADVTIVAQRPKLAPYMAGMRGNVARALGVPPSRVSVKATTTEGLGFEGEGKGISAQAVAAVAQRPGAGV